MSRDYLSGFEPPVLSSAFAESLLAEKWGLVGSTDVLVGERTANIRLRQAPGSSTSSGYVLQVQRATGGLADDVFDMQTRALAHVGQRSSLLPAPARVASVIEASGQPWVRVDDGETPLLARVLTFLDGVTFVGTGELTAEGYLGIGQVIGGLARALSDFEHPVANHPMPWDLGNGLIVDDGLWTVLNKMTADQVAHLRPRIDRVAAMIATLPRQTIHNDVHADNLVRTTPDSSVVTGVIDFGDVVETARVADVAIAAESFAPVHHDPVAVTGWLAAGYCRAAPLTDAEIAMIGELVLARLAMTALLLAHQVESVPRLADRAASGLPVICDRLDRWAQLDPLHVTDTIVTQLAAASDQQSNEGDPK